MRYHLNLVILFLLLTGCNIKQSDNNIFCPKGEMKGAWYESGVDQVAPDIPGLKRDFIVLVDTNFKATNFISSTENLERNLSTYFDTLGLGWSWDEDWNKLTLKEKHKRMEESKILANKRADSIHVANNQGQQQIWIINNTPDTVLIQMQDESYICILQALTKEEQWAPIQYWRFSKCGNSYEFKYFPPKTANSFITTLPKEGNYKTKLRYKLLGKNQYHYSNEFDGIINYCEFVEDSSAYYEIEKGKLRPHFKLDSLIDVTR